MRGGTIYQDLPDENPASKVVHRARSAGDSDAEHEIHIQPDSLLSRLWEGAERVTVNSTHHQGIRAVGAGLVPSAWAPDGLVEAIEAQGHPFFLGVQWHPERMERDPRQRKLFASLVDQALK